MIDMSGNLDAYVAFLVVGVVLVGVDGQLILRSGREYLADVYGDPESAGPMSRLVAVLFHFVVLGLLALLSMIDFSVNEPMRNLVMKLGLLFLVLATVHGATTVMLSRVRERHRAQRVQDEVTARLDGGLPPQAVVTPTVEDRPTATGRSTARDHAEGTTPTSRGAPIPGMINESRSRAWEPHSDT
jgi:hypothetical protein